MAERDRRWLIATAALALGGCALFQPEPIEPPAISLESLDLDAFGLNRQVFRARLRLFNPNTRPLQVEHGEVELELAGVRAAKGRTIAPFVVAPGAEQQVEIRVSMNLLRDAPALFHALSRGDQGGALDYRLTGHVYVARRGPDRMPIQADGRLRLPVAGVGSATGPRL